MGFQRNKVVIAIVCGISLCCQAQHHFPLRSGEWEYTSAQMPGDPMPFCINDDLWEKGLTQNKSCTIHEFNATSTGASYLVDCPLKTFQMNGKVTITYDGMEHMLGNADLQTTVNGKTTSMHTTGEYHWKSSQCSPNDMNLRAGSQGK
jgi:hypothetical protein